MSNHEDKRYNAAIEYLFTVAAGAVARTMLMAVEVSPDDLRGMEPLTRPKFQESLERIYRQEGVPDGNLDEKLAVASMFAQELTIRADRIEKALRGNPFDAAKVVVPTPSKYGAN